MVLDRGTLFKLKVEFDNVQVRDELLYLAVTTLIHLKNTGAPDKYFLLENELRPAPLLVLVFLVR